MVLTVFLVRGAEQLDHGQQLAAAPITDFEVRHALDVLGGKLERRRLFQDSQCCRPAPDFVRRGDRKLGATEEATLFRRQVVANEELLLVLAGTPSLRGSDGTKLLSAGAVIAFPRGDAGAHSLVNHSDAPVRYLVVSTTNRPDVVEYPDTGATLVVLAEQRFAYPRGADAQQRAVVDEAMQAAADRDA